MPVHNRHGCTFGRCIFEQDTLSRGALSGGALSGDTLSGDALSGYALSERIHIRTGCTFTQDAHRGSTYVRSLTRATHSHGMNRYDIGAYSFQLRILFT